MSKPAPAHYKTTNWAKYDTALKARGSLLIWLGTNLQWQAEPSGKPGRSATFSDAAIQFCLSIKCLDHAARDLRRYTRFSSSVFPLNTAHTFTMA